MKLKLSDKASSELGDAMDWFDEQATGLGAKFRVSIGETFSYILENPMSGKNVRRGIQTRLNLKFSYKIAYKIHLDKVVIISIWHAARNITM
ncbi:MAG: type II toxin-antitoxin system RelE/ParE family toxin [Planctomycetota bacterium]